MNAPPRVLDILVVEDERIIALLTASLVQRLGHRVAGSLPSGEMAVEYASSESVDLILMDIRLDGDLDGIEAVERIQAIRPVPVVYITAYTDQQTLDRAGRTSHLGFLPKPLDPDRLREIIAGLSGGGSSSPPPPRTPQVPPAPSAH
jgi:CheY-like chemotaxis protein